MWKSHFLQVFAISIFLLHASGPHLSFGQESAGASETKPSSDEGGNNQLKIPPIQKLGDKGPRVRELQSTLNKILLSRFNELGRPIPLPDGWKIEPSNDKTNPYFLYNENLKLRINVKKSWNVNDTENAIGFSNDPKKPPLKVDGIYAEQTFVGVMLFQQTDGLRVTGEVDAVTLDHLEPLVPTNPILAGIMSWVIDSGWGGPDHDSYPRFIKRLTSFFAILLLLIASVVVYQIAKYLESTTKFVERWLFTPTNSPWFKSLRDKKVFARLVHFAPAVFIYVSSQVIFPQDDLSNVEAFPYLNTFQMWGILLARVGLTYLAVISVMAALAIADSFEDIYSALQQEQNPIEWVVRSAKRLILFIGVVLVISAILGKTPMYLIGGLGAFAAIIMLIFKDSILGFSASVQIVAHNMVKVGDWIEMPKFGADGDVTEISLSTVKVQNFDKTISTVPTKCILSESFRNWSGMRSSGGRRIKRAIHIDTESIKVCTPEMIDQFESIELIEDYIQQKKNELDDYNELHDIESSIVNSRRLTNIGTFRAYLEAYLNHHPGLAENMTVLVRHLQPTKIGLPIEIYAFSGDTDWKKYEAVQADIMDHVLSILPEFGLRAFQEVSNPTPTAQAGDKKPAGWHKSRNQVRRFIEEQNGYLKNHPRADPNLAFRKVNEKIKDLNVEKYFDASLSGREIYLSDPNI